MELHPAIVHFPIALLTVAALFAVISLFTKKEFFKEGAFWNLLLGVMGAIAAVITGLMEERTLVHNDAIHEILEKHEMNGIAILILSFGLLTWCWVRKNKFGKTEYRLWVSLLVLGTAMIFYQGYLGGRMVFEKGAGVKPMEVHMSDSGSTHLHSDPGHDHAGSKDSASSKSPAHDHSYGKDSVSTRKIQKPDHPGPAHDHTMKPGIVKKNDSIPVNEKKKELKDMKY